MTLSYKAAPVAIYDGNDRIFFKSFPWPTPGGDPGLGGGGSESITVKMGAGDYRLAWNGSPPSGLGYPASPTLAGSEPFWIHGIHGYGRVTWSPTYGVVVSGVSGLSPTGTVRHINTYFHHSNDVNPDHCWKYMGKWYGYGGSGQPGPDAWDYHFGFDHGLQADLVCVIEENRLYTISGSAGSPATRGTTPVWSATAAHISAGYLLNCGFGGSGLDRVNLGWRNEWWIAQVLDSGDGSNAIIWGFNRSQTGDSSAFTVAIPSAARSRLTSGYPDNLALTVDQTGHRIFAYQADILASSQAQNGRTKFPLLLWEIDPVTHSWTQVSIPSTLYVTPPGKSRGHNPMCWANGFRWIYWDVLGDSGGNIYYATPDSTAGFSYTQGGFRPINIFIPKNGAPRNITFTSNAAGSIPGIGDGWTGQKHNEYQYRTANDRVYLSGGDIDGGGDGQQGIYSFDPENAASTMTVEQNPIFTGMEVRPVWPDEHGWAYKAATDEFWFIYGYPYPTYIGPPEQGTWPAAANLSDSTWHSTTGGTQVLWKWNPTTKVWTTHTLSAASGETGPFGGETVDPLTKITSAHQKRWYYDSVANRLVIAAYGGSITLQTPCVKIVELSSGSPQYRVYVANRLASVPSGNVMTFGDGRQINIGVTPLWNEDSAAFDSTTGYLYVYNTATGDLLRVKTWTSVGNTAYPTYSFAGQAHLPVEWCCKLPATPGTANLTKFAVMHGAAWAVITTASNRARVFSWAPGDAHAWEHDTPYGMCAGAITVYKKAGVDKLMAIGGAAIKTLRNAPPYKRIWTGAVS